MSRILINTTIAPIIIPDVGITISNILPYTIPADEQLDWAVSTDIITQIVSGNIVVNDGVLNLNISNGIDLLRGFFPRAIQIQDVGGEKATVTNSRLDVNATVVEPPGGSRPHTISNAIRTDFSYTYQSLPRSSQPIKTIYEYTGSGVFYGLIAYFNSDDVILELEVDGNTIFSFEIEHLDDFKEEESAIPWFKYEDKQVSYEPRFGIKFNSEIKIKAKSDTNSSSKKLRQYLVNIEKVT